MITFDIIVEGTSIRKKKIKILCVYFVLCSLIRTFANERLSAFWG